MHKFPIARAACISALAFAFSLTCLRATASDQGAGVQAWTDWVDARISSSSDALSRYASSHSLDDLRTAVDMMDGTVPLDSLTSFNFVARRRALVTGWTRVLRAIEQSYDPTFDPNLSMGCPISPGLMPCVDPSSIRDPVARAKYATRLAEFHHYLTQSYRYNAIHLLDRRAMTVLEMSIMFLREIAPNRTPPDYKALESIVHEANLSQAREARIDTWLTVWYTLSARCIWVHAGDPAIALTMNNRSSTDWAFALRPLLSVGGRAGLTISREIPIDANSALVARAGLVKANSTGYILGSPRAWVDLVAFRRQFPRGWYSLEYCDGSGTCSNAVQIKLE